MARPRSFAAGGLDGGAKTSTWVLPRQARYQHRPTQLPSPGCSELIVPEKLRQRKLRIWTAWEGGAWDVVDAPSLSVSSSLAWVEEVTGPFSMSALLFARPMPLRPGPTRPLLFRLAAPGRPNSWFVYVCVTKIGNYPPSVLPPGHPSTTHCNVLHPDVRPAHIRHQPLPTAP